MIANNLYRGFRPDTEKWICGYYCGPIQYFDFHEIVDVNDPVGARYTVMPESVGMCTNKRQWDTLDPSVDGFICEGDIVEVVAMRKPSGEWNPQSQYDGRYRIRAVVYYNDSKCMFMLDYDNSYNNNLLRLRGNEQNERVFGAKRELGSFCTEGRWEKENYYRGKTILHYGMWHPNHSEDIKVIGNTFQNSDLLKAGTTYSKLD